jgi:type II secretory pathway pseudopilin PulG
MRVTTRNKGATVLEITAAMIIIAILAAGAGTALYSAALAARNEAAIRQLASLRKAIAGEHRTNPERQEVDLHGYIGDMGSLPPSLSALENAGAQPDFVVDPILQLGAGWRGPYVGPAVAAGLTDPWGNALIYSLAAGVSASTGAPTVASILSPGGDAVAGTADDHVVEIYKSETFAGVTGFVKDAAGGVVPGVTVTLSYPSDGAVSSATAVTGDDGLYTFADIPHGSRTLQLAGKLAYVQGSGRTSGNNRNNLEFVVENLGKDAVSISSVRLSWMTTPASDFKRLLIDGAQMFSGTVASGTALTISPPGNAAGTGVLQAPVRIDVSGLTLIAPDLTIGTTGTGGFLTLAFEDFEETGNNNDVDITGVNFTAEFSDGSKIVFAPLRK